MIVVLEVHTNIKRAKTFLCGGFRAADQMWEAIYEGWTDGIMVARPLAAEPGDNDSYFEDCFYEPLIRSQGNLRTSFRVTSLEAVKCSKATQLQ